MNSSLGLRERKKIEMRHRVGDVAARLFATNGYDAVSMSDVARAADVSEQTVYNYFPTKPDLVLDRAEEIRERFGQIVRDRAEGSTPADAILVTVHEDIERFVSDDDLARGEYPALCVDSLALRRFALESREHQAETITSAILTTNPHIAPLLVAAHAAALIFVVQAITDRIGRAILDGTPRITVARILRDDATRTFTGLSDQFLAMISAPPAA